MTQTAQRVLEQFHALDESDQAELSRIIADRHAIRSDMEYVKAWSAELRQRITRHESGEVPGVPWEQLRKELVDEDARGE
jgi:putative addiction module component (TIGR02574 family)